MGLETEAISDAFFTPRSCKNQRFSQSFLAFLRNQCFSQAAESSEEKYCFFEVSEDLMSAEGLPRELEEELIGAKVASRLHHTLVVLRIVKRH